MNNQHSTDSKVKLKRYYLHRKIKNFGGVVHSKRRLVELEDELFRHPSALLSTYLFKLNQFNYSIQSVIMATPAKTTSTTVATLLPKETMVEKFRYVASKLPILEKSSLDLKVESDEQLTIAENNASEALSLLKEVDSVRKTLKAPYADTVKMIDSYCKTITDSLDRIKTRFSAEITAYRVIQQASARAEMESKLKELEVLEKEKKEESEKIIRIEAQMIARIFGGSYKKKDGTIETFAGQLTSFNCKELLTWMNQRLPPISDFKHFPVLYEDTVTSIKKKLAEHTSNLIILESEDGMIAKEGAVRRTAELRTEASKEILEKGDKIEKLIDKSIRKEVRTMENEVKDAGKGVRKELRWDVIDELAVPRDILSVDTMKISKYINENREKIKTQIVNGEEILPGIKFYFADNFVTR